MSTDYGFDINTPGCLDLDPAFASIAGTDAVLQAAVRGLSTAQGSLPDAPEWGYDLRAHLNDHETSPRLIASAVETQVLRDERVRRASATVTVDAATGALAVSLVLVLAEGTFRLVLAVTAVSVELLAAEAA